MREAALMTKLRAALEGERGISWVRKEAETTVLAVYCKNTAQFQKCGRHRDAIHFKLG